MDRTDDLTRLASARPPVAEGGDVVLDERQRADLVAAIVGSAPAPRSPRWGRPPVRRRTWAVVVAVAVALVVGLLYGPRSSDHPPTPTGHRGPSTTTPPPASSTSFLGRDIPRSVTFDSIARLGGVLVASGSVAGRCFGSDAPSCRTGSGRAADHRFVQPVVWRSADDGYRWTEAWDPGRPLIEDTAAFSRLVPGPDGGLLLFDSGTPGTELLSATKATAWTRVVLPAAMAGAGLRTATNTGSEVVVSLVHHAGGVTSFSTTDGTTWVASGPGSSIAHAPQLESEGLGVVSFGANPSAVESALEPDLGAPTATPRSGCAYSHGPPQFTEIEWGDLVVEFNEGFFVGYRDIVGGWASIGSVERATGAPDPVLTTSSGIGLGSTYAQLQAAYPGLIHAGSFTWTSPNGIHFLFGSDPTMNPDSTVTEIKTGTCGDF
ncbi:MAG: hypothetical protein ACRDY1_00505 [Acidimicrobiales bacterium]